MVWREHDEASAAAARAMVKAMFSEPEFDGVDPVAEDWMGRQYCLSGRQLLLFDPGYRDVYEVDYDTVDDAMTGDPAFYLCADLLRQWRARHPEPVPGGRCVGYRRPLFLGGTATVDNLEVVITEVYWSINGQIWRQVEDLPPGTPISGVSFG